MPTEKPNNSTPDSEISELFRHIREAGFPLVGGVDLSLAREEFTRHTSRYENWLRKGHQGEMKYLERGLERRLDPTLVFPEAKSVIVCAIPYRRNPTLPIDAESPRYARYLEGPDYHRKIPDLLTGALERWGIPAKWKICVDTSAILERSWAAIAGIGWIGKNTLLIHPQYGSYLFLGVILLDRETGLGPAPLPNYCGNCTSCLSGCPTGAIIQPGELDARKCTSYLTLEKRGEWDASSETATKKMGRWIAGCDICQEVCPYNRKPLRLPETWPDHSRDEALLTDWQKLAAEDETTYRERAATSALSRIRFLDMRRNLLNARTQPGLSSD